MALEDYLISRGIASFSLDGDNLRGGLNKNLGFAASDREENVRRASEVSNLFACAGFVCITSFISPFAKDRFSARQVHENGNTRFFEVYVSTPLEGMAKPKDVIAKLNIPSFISVCEKRDPKGLYNRARSGNISSFTGIDAAYEPPTNPDLLLPTQELSVAECVQRIAAMLVDAEVLAPSVIDTVHELFVPEARLSTLKSEANQLPALNINTVDLQWVQVLAEGWAFPLKGFMNERQYLQSLHFGAIFDEKWGEAHNFALPITLAISDSDKARLDDAVAVSLTHCRPQCGDEKKIIAVMRNLTFFPYRKEEHCHRIFGSNSADHPGVKMVMESGDWLIGGSLEVLEKITWNDGLDDYRLTPNQLKARARDLGADALISYQPKYVMHNGHVSSLAKIQKQLLESSAKYPVILLNPIGGRTNDNVIPIAVRIQQQKAFIEANAEGLNNGNTILAIFPAPMMYAGPREMQWHCRARIVAGASFYAIYQSDVTKDDFTLLSMAPGLNSMDLVLLEDSDSNDVKFTSETELLRLTAENSVPPAEIMLPEAWAVLSEYFKTNLECKHFENQP